MTATDFDGRLSHVRDMVLVLGAAAGKRDVTDDVRAAISMVSRPVADEITAVIADLYTAFRLLNDHGGGR